MTETVSFVIPVRSDAVRLDRCLRSIRANRYAPDRIEIVVADNGSTDASASVARKHGAKVLDLPALGLGALRNTAASAAEGSIFAFVDADHEIDPDWVAVAVSLLRDPHVGGVGTTCVPPQPGTWVQRSYDRLRSHPTGTETVDWLGSGNLAVRREAFMAAGGFDTTLETCEDVDLCRKLRANGVQLLADGRLRSIHYGDPATLRHVFLGELWRGRDNIRVSVRPPRSARMLISGILPVANLAGLAGVLIGLTPLAGTSWTVVGVAAGLVLTLIGLRTIVMLRRGGLDRASAIPQAFLVASAYEFGRVFAVLGRFGYGRRRVTTAQSDSLSHMNE